MKLDDIRPKKSEFHLKLLGETCFLDPITLDHEMSFMEKLGDDWVNNILSENNLDNLLWVVYRLLSKESKALFIRRDITVYDDDGIESIKSIGGVALLKKTISGAKESESLVVALVENIGLSRPIPDEETDSSKKKAVK